MTKYYSDELNTQILVALLKEHGIRKIIASPGTTNASLVGSLQYDSYFHVYSSVDERSAAYMACGLAAETGEPVVLTCTGATASRNYLPGLTEAYYRKLPILAITSSQRVSNVGHHIAQVIDRSVMPEDTVGMSIEISTVLDDHDIWDCQLKVNKAILGLKHHGGGPIHINLVTNYGTFNTKTLPSVKKIDRIVATSAFPVLPPLAKIAIFVGAHVTMSENLTRVIDKFCATNNAVVFCDHTSGYKGKFRVLYALALSQINPGDIIKPDLTIHIGEVTGDYYGMNIVSGEVWRVSEDGQIRDTFKRLRYIFEMPEEIFFKHYSKEDVKENKDYFLQCQKNLKRHYNKIPELPFSNIWFAYKMAHLIPEGSIIHFAILNSLRSWNFFELPALVQSSSNVGGFGIDGCLSTLIGASLNNRDKLYFGVIGDLAFFYDMNVMGNRHVGNNLRILLVNNGVGTEFKNYKHHVAQFTDDANSFMAAAGHYGNKSIELVKNYATNLGFEYLSASNKEEFEIVYQRFLTQEITEKSMVFEVFTTDKDESLALETIMNIEETRSGKAKDFAKHVLGQNGVNSLKKFIKTKNV